jgi:hypothetical protein
MSPLDYVLVAIIAVAVLAAWRRRRRVKAVVRLAETYVKLVHDLELLVRLRTTGVSPKEIVSIFLRDSSLDGNAVVKMDYEYLRPRSSNAGPIIFGLEFELLTAVDNTYTELLIALGVYVPKGVIVVQGVVIAPPPNNKHS